MNDTRDELSETDPAERLIARIVERDARPADYDAFGHLAHSAPARWNELLLALRDDDALHLAVDASLATVERVELPAAPRGGALLRAARPWSGWMAAAALALVWFASSEREQLVGSPARPSDVGNEWMAGEASGLAGGPLAHPASLDDAVLGELPARLVSSQRSADGAGFDLLYLQPVLRRTRVDRVYGVGQDEHGRPAPVPVDPAVLVRHENL